MRFRFTAGARLLALAMAVGAAAAPGLGQATAAQFQPFSAVRTVETQNSMGKILSTSYALEERDSSGRRLTARLDEPAYGGKLTQVTITDPVKMRRIEINYVARTATVTQFLPAAADKLLPPTKPFETNDPNRSDLGDKTLNGYKVHGYTWTANDPNPGDGELSPVPGAAASTSFNPTAYPLTHESWWSPELSVFLLTSTRDGNGYKQTIQYDQIRQKEPGADDFAIPAGFHVRTIAVGSTH